jgi:hypothetical protein
MMGSTISRKTTTRAKRRTSASGPELVERYTPKRRAQFLLQNAVSAADYAAARREVRKLGLDPDAIPHDKPTSM